MAELLFIATIIFVAYVLFEVLGEKKENPEPIKADPPKTEPQTPESSAPQLAAAREDSVASEPEAVKLTPVKTAPSKTPKAKTSTANKPIPPSPPLISADSLKNPKTGEVAKIPANYTFAKRWIKDALVEEGLLDKIYKNNELDDATSSRIHEALQKLQAMEKYR